MAEQEQRDKICCDSISVKEKLLSLEFQEKDINFLLQEGAKFFSKPIILAKKLKISEDKAKKAIEALKSERMDDDEKSKMKKIKETVQENPEIDDNEDIALLCGVEKYLVAKYFESLPLNDNQTNLIAMKFNDGYSIPEISKILGFSVTKVEKYVETTQLSFTGDEGEMVLEIIYKNIEKKSVSQLREKIAKKDMDLQYYLGESLRVKNISEFEIVQEYLKKYDMSKEFLAGNFELSIEEIEKIKKNNNLGSKILSVKLNKAEPIIRKYLQQYNPNEGEIRHYRNQQYQRLQAIGNAFGVKIITYDMYRVIITHSLEDILNRSRSDKDKLMKDLLHFALYYLKCGLPFKDIVNIFNSLGTRISLTKHDLFHLIYQLADPVLKGLCIENYSFSNPVPLYYPKIYSSVSKEIEFDVCKELWYCLEQHYGLISFGLGRASWNAIGKSCLLDKMFQTDFEKTSPQKSGFHFSSIDIQITKNLFWKELKKSTNWAYIDCHGFSDLKVIKYICGYVNIALIHVCHCDIVENYSQLREEISIFAGKNMRIYLFIRDSQCANIIIETKEDDWAPGIIRVYIPDLTKEDIDENSVKKIGYEILHPHLEKPKLIHSEFIEELMGDMHSQSFKEIKEDKELIKKIIRKVDNKIGSFTSINFGFLNYYPLFIDYMSSYHRAAYESDQDEIDKLNTKCGELNEKLKKTNMGDIVVYFNEILKRNNYTLILWKLSQELSIYTKRLRIDKEYALDKIRERKNDKYSLEIIWREALLSQKYESESNGSFFEHFSTNFSNYVERGEAFELIDGDNMRYFNKDIDELLCKFYSKKSSKINCGKAPIVVSIFGPQSSGKSTLLNYCFGCKFLTSSGRCTRGIYGALSKLSQPVNGSEFFLILDTEGLDAIERENITDTSTIHFDRTMVLFCLSVSQVVIINVKGEIGTEMQNLLQICAYSLSRLKVSKVKAPKIFFVLNQQADPDPSKHIDSINLLLSRLNSESELREIEGIKISDLIEVSRDNLFILPSAFNFETINNPGAKLFDSEVIKLSPTLSFAQECAKLRLAIIKQLKMPNDRTPFNSMSEWMEMSGVVWDMIIQYQDIVRFRNIDELKCDKKLKEITEHLIEKYINENIKHFNEKNEVLIVRIKKIDSLQNRKTVLRKIMDDFDEVFSQNEEKCIQEFTDSYQSDRLLKRNSDLCDERRRNIQRLLFVEKKQYEDQLELHKKSVTIELKLSDLMNKFQSAISNNPDEYMEMDSGRLEQEFETTWKKAFDDSNEELMELEEYFNNLYSIFKMEWYEMEKQQTIFEIFRDNSFKMKNIIDALEKDILKAFTDPFSWSASEQFIYAIDYFQGLIKDMSTFEGSAENQYLSPDSLYQCIEKKKYFFFGEKINQVKIHEWIKPECHPLVKFCSGWFSHPDIIWTTAKKEQILILASVLKDPKNHSRSTWTKFSEDLSTDVRDLQKKYSNYPQILLKLLINSLNFRIKLLKYEIKYIHASLSNVAERKLSTLVFAYAFKSLLEFKTNQRNVNITKKKQKKQEYHQYFHGKVAILKIIRGTWGPDKMSESDKRISEIFALDFIRSIKREIELLEQTSINAYFKELGKKELSHGNLLSESNETILNELSNDPEKQRDNFVVQYICDRNKLFLGLFDKKWEPIEKKIYENVSEEISNAFESKMSNIVLVLHNLLEDLKNRAKPKDYDSSKIFELAEFTTSTLKSYSNQNLMKEIPFKAMMVYLKKYFDPNVTPDQFSEYFSKTFEVSNFKVRMTDALKSFCKPAEPTLSKELYRKLIYIKMFNSDLIFNLYDYVQHFYSVICNYKFHFKEEEFREMISTLKEEYRSNAIGCPSQCPSCGKFCEREIHPNDGKCQIRTGHQISSMGGKVWSMDLERTALLLMCDDYNDDTQVVMPCGLINWGDFKEKCANQWDWTVPDDENYESKKISTKKTIINIWNTFGRAILDYYFVEYGTDIKFVPYSSEAVKSILTFTKYFICFVIDGTASMSKDIDRVRLSVGQLIKHIVSRGSSSEFKVVVYRDHCDSQLIEKFPADNSFTSDQISVEDFLKKVRAYGGGDLPEAVLDGLATGATGCDWENISGVQNKIIHIFDAPPHGNFPKYKSHSKISEKKNCCCCNHGTICKFSWEKDVWPVMKRFNIGYHGINTSLSYPKFEATMKEKLGKLCDKFQFVGKEKVDDAILKIFNYKK